MTTAGVTMARVLIGRFNPVMRLGLRDLLCDAGRPEDDARPRPRPRPRPRRRGPRRQGRRQGQRQGPQGGAEISSLVDDAFDVVVEPVPPPLEGESQTFDLSIRKGGVVEEHHPGVTLGARSSNVATAVNEVSTRIRVRRRWG